MSSNYTNISISGLEYVSIRKFEITQKANEHARAEIWAEVDKNVGQDFITNLVDNDVITINTGSEKFVGLIIACKIVYEDIYAVLQLSLGSTTMLLDVQSQSHSYQVIGTNYSDIINKSFAGQGILDFNGNDKASESMVVQYGETKWKFAMRLCAECQEPMFADFSSEVPHVYIGNVPGTANTAGNITTNQGSQGTSTSPLIMGSNMNGGVVSGLCCRMENGHLVTSYQSTDKQDIIPQVQPPRFAGRVFNGVCKGVDGDRIQVLITDLDEEFDGESNVWLSYSTLYSSSEYGSGIYMMPVDEDPVRVFFPTENLADAFASSSYTVRGMAESKEEKKFETPAGMSVTIGKDGLLIMGEGKKMYIALSKDGTIVLESENKIYVHAKKNIGLTATEGRVNLIAEKNISFVTGHSLISLAPKATKMVSDRILTQ